MICGVVVCSVSALDIPFADNVISLSKPCKLHGGVSELLSWLNYSIQPATER